MAQIAKAAAETLARKIVRKAHEAEYMKLLKVYVDASWKAWRAVVPGVIQLAFDQHPNMFSKTYYGHVRHRGQKHTVLFSPNAYGGWVPRGWSGIGGKDFPWGPNLNGVEIAYKPADLDKVVDAEEALLAKIAAIQEVETQLQATILGHRTWKRLAEGWPEIKSEIPADYLDPAKPASYLPVDTSSLTKALGLPFPKETP